MSGEPSSLSAGPAAPVAEELGKLIATMPDRYETLAGVIRFAERPKPLDSVASKADELQANNRSAFSGMSLCRLLERCGALSRTTVEGDPYPQDAAEPKKVMIDGVAYIEPATPPTVCWTADPEALRVVNADNPEGRMESLFESEPEYLHVYKFILSAASAPEGAKTKEIGAVVDKDQATQSPRKYTGRFTDRLRMCGALAWTGHEWRTTEIGLKGLVMLEAV